MKKNIEMDIEQITEIINDSKSFLLVTDKAFVKNGDTDEIIVNLMGAVLQSDEVKEIMMEIMDFFFSNGRELLREKALQEKIGSKLTKISTKPKSKLDIN